MRSARPNSAAQNNALVLLAVLVIECGGGLSLAVGMSLSAVPSATMDAEMSAPGHSQTVPSATPDAPVSGQPLPPSRVRPFDVAAWLKLQGGRAETSMRRLADALGRSRSGVHEELRRLVASGLITAASGPRGTVMAMVGAANRSDGPPPMKWSDSKYGFAIEEDCNGEEETQAGRDRCEVASG
jgi:biotin operon repressor